MKKNAFTLIELIAVIVILSLIALVVFPAVNSVIKNSKEKSFEQQKNAIIKAAKECSYENTIILPNTVDKEYNQIPLECLTKGCTYKDKIIEGGYLEYDENGDQNTSLVVDPRNTSKYLEGKIKITYEKSKNQYIYEYVEN